MGELDERLERDLAREQLFIADNSKRIKAYVIDDLLVTLVAFFAFFDQLMGATNIVEMVQVVNALSAPIVVIGVVYHTVFVWMYGATLGKLYVKIAVIEQDGLYKPSFIYSFLRASIRIISAIPFYLGFIWAFLNPAKQTWHDKLAKTIVVEA